MHRITQFIVRTAKRLQNFLKHFQLFSGNSRLELQFVSTVKLIGSSHFSFCLYNSWDVKCDIRTDFPKSGHICSYMCVSIICDWICKNWSYHSWQKIHFFAKNTQRHINTLSSFTAKMKKSREVCFCWILFPSTLAIRTNSLGP